MVFGPTKELLHLVETSSELTIKTLRDRDFLGSGTFSHVYGIDDCQVLKLSWDLESLHVLKRLADQSDYFPKVFEIAENQAKNDNDSMLFHSAVVERLANGRPEWVDGLVNEYRNPWRVEGSGEAFIRLTKISYKVKCGDLDVAPGHADGLAAALAILAKECLESGLIADLRTNLNFMTRQNGTVVIADPAHPMRYMSGGY